MKEEELWIGEKPVFWISPEARDEILRANIALFSLDVLTQLRKTGPNMPMDILAVGDNWTLLVAGREEPKNAQEKALKALDPHRVFGAMYPLNERPEGVKFSQLHQDILSIEARGFLEDRILDEYAILDRTSIAYPIFDENEENEIEVLEEKSWGRIVRPLSGYKVMVYHLKRF